MTTDAERLWSAFRKVRRMSSGMAVNLQIVYAEAGFDQNTTLGRQSAHLALRELEAEGVVVGVAPPPPGSVINMAERRALREVGADI